MKCTSTHIPYIHLKGVRGPKTPCISPISVGVPFCNLEVLGSSPRGGFRNSLECSELPNGPVRKVPQERVALAHESGARATSGPGQVAMSRSEVQIHKISQLISGARIAKLPPGVKQSSSRFFLTKYHYSDTHCTCVECNRIYIARPAAATKPLLLNAMGGELPTGLHARGFLMIRSPRILWITPFHAIAAPEYLFAARLKDSEAAYEDIFECTPG